MGNFDMKLGAAAEDYAFASVREDCIDVWEDGMRIKDPAPGSYEWWYVDGHFKDGSLLSVAFHNRKEADGSLLTFINFNYAGPGKRVMKRLICNPIEFSADQSCCDVQFGPNFIRGEGLDVYEIFVEPESNENYGVQLRLERTAPSYRPGSGYFRSDDEYFAWLCAVPAGKLSGTITIDGQVIEVDGSGYHDHNWGNVPIDKLMADWHWGRAEVDGYTIVMADVRARYDRGGGEMPLVYVVKDGEIVLDAINEAVTCLVGGPQEQPDTGKRIPSDCIFVVNVEDKNSYIRFKGGQIIGTFQWVNTDPSWETWYSRFSSRASIELNVGNNKIDVVGPAILEHMDFYGRKKG
jgi:hypothetical protein